MCIILNDKVLYKKGILAFSGNITVLNRPPFCFWSSEDGGGGGPENKYLLDKYSGNVASAERRCPTEGKQDQFYFESPELQLSHRNSFLHVFTL